MRTRRILVVLSFVTLMFLFTAGIASAKDGGKSATANKFNIVFVTDESGSMEGTDPKKLRNDSIALFLGLMTKSGNKVGSVTFSDRIVDANPIRPIDGNEAKKSVIDRIRRKSKTGGDTDIGKALGKAVSMLDKDGDSALPSAIILLTDGHTDLDNDDSTLSKAERKSNQKKSQAIEAARDRGYKIYTVCLNANGDAKYSEARQIAKATGGKTRQIKNPKEMIDVYRMFYGMIYGEKIGNPKAVPSNGVLTFKVPAAGVKEANIMIYGNIRKCKVMEPSGAEYKNLDTFKVGDVLLKKIIDPSEGTWKVEVSGDKRVKVKYNLIFNYDFSVVDNANLRKTRQYHEGDTIPLSGQLKMEDGEVISKKAQKAFQVSAVFLNAEDKVIDTQSMKPKGDSWVLDYKVADDKTSFQYYLSAKYNGGEGLGDVEKRTQPVQILVSNATPTSNGDVVAKVKVWPYKGGSYKLDLTTLAKDKEDDELKYVVKSSSFIDKAEDSKEGDYSVEGNRLLQDGFSLPKGSYIIRCTDSGGLYCDVKVTVKSYNIGKLTLLGLGIIALIVLFIMGILAYIAATKPFLGTIYIRSNGMSGYDRISPARGKARLWMFSELPQTSLNHKKTYFQATGKPSIEFIPDRPVYLAGRDAKIIRINSSPGDTTVYLDREGREYLCIRFESMLDGMGGRGGRRRSRNPISAFFGAVGGLFSGSGRRGARGGSGQHEGGRRGSSPRRDNRARKGRRSSRRP